VSTASLALPDLTQGPVGVRPEVREEALRLQQRLRQLVADGNPHAKRTSKTYEVLSDSPLLMIVGRSPTADEYNDTAPFPFDVRVNDKTVEVLAPVEPKDNGKKCRNLPIHTAGYGIDLR
jgi:hypothetical protein